MKIIASILILLFYYNLAFSHSCISYKNANDTIHTNQLNQVKAIFSGEVISAKEISKSVYLVELKVLRVWKGIEKDKVTIKYNDPCSYSNEFIFPIGSKMMIYGYSIENSELIDVNCCNLSLFDDERMKKVYGEGKVIEELQTSPTPTKSAESFWTIIWKKITSFFS